MYSVNSTVIKPLSEYNHQFALCESCFWCATIFDKSSEQEEKRQYPIMTLAFFINAPYAKTKAFH